MEVAQPLCQGSGAHHLSGTHTGGCPTTMSEFTISRVCTLEVAQPLCRGSPSLSYAHWRLLNHCVRVHHLSGMHSGGFTISYVRTLEVAQPLCWGSWFTISQVCTLEVAQPLCWGAPSLRYAHWRLVNHYVGVHGSPSLRYAHWGLLSHYVGVQGLTISQVHVLEVDRQVHASF